ncbi:MAG: hypothetical protein RR255_00020 [Bacilli bacterium]
MEFLVNNKNFNIVKIGDKIQCFSYEKMIGTFIINEKKFFIFDAEITTITNKKHLQQFKKYLIDNFFITFF